MTNDNSKSGNSSSSGYTYTGSGTNSQVNVYSDICNVHCPHSTLKSFRVTIIAVARVSMAAEGTTTQTRTCQYMCLIHASYLFLVVVMEATITRTLMVLHTTTVELGMPNTLLPVVKPPRSRYSEWYVGDLSIYESQSELFAGRLLIQEIENIVHIESLQVSLTIFITLNFGKHI